MMNKELSPTQQIRSWFQLAHPNPSDRDAHNQAADHLTTSLAFLLACQEVGSTSATREELGFAVNVIDFIQRRVTSQSLGIELSFADLDREMMLKALCQQVRSCVGLAHMLEMDIEGALIEMVDSDRTRLGSDGQPVFNIKNRIVDGPGSRRPNYMQFT